MCIRDRFGNSRAAGKSVNDVTVDDIRKYGHLSIADADEYADTVYRIPEEGIEYEGSDISNLSGERMPLYATDLYEYGNDGVGRYPFGIERNELVTRESVEPKYSLTGQELVDFLEQYDGNAGSTNASEGYEGYLSRVNPSGTRIAAEDRPNLMMGDMYGMLPRGSDIIGEKGDVTFHRSPDGDYYATAYNPDVGEQDVVGYIMGRGDSTELQVVSEMQGQGIGGELQYLFRSENPDAPTGGLTEAGERALERTYDRLFDEGLVSANASKTSGFMGQLLNADDIPKPEIRNLFSEDVYHYMNTNKMEGDVFDSSKSFSRLDRLGPHVGTAKAAEDRYHAFYARSPELVKDYLNLTQSSTGMTMPLKARVDRPFLNEQGQPFQESELLDVMNKYADDNNIKDLDVAAAQFRKDLTDAGFTNVPYVNAIEDRGSISHIMLTGRTAGDPEVLRSRFARFQDPYDESIMAANASALGGLLTQSLSEKQANKIEDYLYRTGLLQ